MDEKISGAVIPTTGAYFGRMLLLCIPVINIVAAFVWGFAGETIEKKRFGRGALLVIAAVIVLSVICALAAYYVMKGLLLQPAA